MRKEDLTAKQVEHAKPRESRYEVPAGPPKGLYLVVHPTGAKTWAFRYRYRGKTYKLTYDPFPKMGLAAARAEAESAIADLENNINPAGTKANEQAEEQREELVEVLQRESVGDAIEEFIKIGLRKKEKLRGETERILRREVLSKWKNRTVSDIRKRDVIELLRPIVDRGASVMACRTRGVMIRLFDWCIDEDRLEGNSPMDGVKKPGEDHSDRERFLDKRELAEVWAGSSGMGYPFGQFMQFLILTAQRRGEVATMRWADLNIKDALWIVPAEATKNGRDHHVPLSQSALTILQSLPRFKYIGEDGKERPGEYVWTTTNGEKPINGFSKAKRRIDTKILETRKVAGVKEPIPGWTMHDLRRTAVTLMAQYCGVAEHILTRIINHTPVDREVSKILKIYNQHPYMPERQVGLEAWAKFVVGLESKSKRKATA